MPKRSSRFRTQNTTEHRQQQHLPHLRETRRGQESWPSGQRNRDWNPAAVSRSRAGRASRHLPRPQVRRPSGVVQTPKLAARRVTFLQTRLGEPPLPRKRARRRGPHRSRCCPTAVRARLRAQAPLCGRRACTQGRFPGARTNGVAPVPRPAPPPAPGRSRRLPSPSPTALLPSCFFAPALAHPARASSSAPCPQLFSPCRERVQHLLFDHCALGVPEPQKGGGQGTLRSENEVSHRERGWDQDALTARMCKIGKNTSQVVKKTN